MASTTRPRGTLQRLLQAAVLDQEFRCRLLEQRGDVAEATGLLSESERAVLAAVTGAQLENMIQRTPVPERARRSFLRQTAITAAALLTGATLLDSVACAPQRFASKGATPDMPPPREPVPEQPGEDDAEPSPDAPDERTE